MEASDLSQLLKALSNDGLPVRRIGILGISYGAAVALDTAAVMPNVGAVVAVAPYARVLPAVRAYIKMAEPRTSAAQNGAEINRAFTLTGQIVGYPLSSSDPLPGVPGIQAHVLYIAAKNDRVASLKGVEELQRATHHSRLSVLNDKNHITVATDVKTLDQLATQWFVRFLGAGQ